MNKTRSCGRTDCPANKAAECDYFNVWVTCLRHKEITSSDIIGEEKNQ
jgi:hypothetical protein